MRHHPNFIQVISVLKPLLRRYRPLSVMHFDDMLDWLAWYWNRGTMAYVIEDNQPKGVCLIRLFRHLDQFIEVDAHEPSSEFAFIEVSIAEDGQVMAQMLADLENRWGPQKCVMWDRGVRTEDGPPRMYSWNQFKKLARRLEKYGWFKTA